MTQQPAAPAAPVTPPEPVKPKKKYKLTGKYSKKFPKTGDLIKLNAVKQPKTDLQQSVRDRLTKMQADLTQGLKDDKINLEQTYKVKMKVVDGLKAMLDDPTAAEVLNGMLQ